MNKKKKKKTEFLAMLFADCVSEIKYLLTSSKIHETKLKPIALVDLTKINDYVHWNLHFFLVNITF